MSVKRSALQRFSFRLALFFAVLAIAPRARADCDELPCSVIRNCSSTGVACKPDDRTCTEEARAKNLEVKCEQTCSDGKRLVYCPPDTGRGDESRAVWLLFSLAVFLAVFGSAVAWVVLRKKVKN